MERARVIRQMLRGNPRLRSVPEIRAICQEVGIDPDKVDLRGARSRTRPPRPARDRLHVERGGTNAEEAARWTDNVDLFREIAVADAPFLSVRSEPKDPALRAAYREWLRAVGDRVLYVVVNGHVNGVRFEQFGDRYVIFLPPDHPAAGKPEPWKASQKVKNRVGAAYRRLINDELAELLPDAETTPDDVKQRRKRWRRVHPDN